MPRITKENPLTNYITREEIKRIEVGILKSVRVDQNRTDHTLDCSGVCKDCGNGTMNNRIAEAFDYNGFGPYCLNCGSTHVDIIEL